MNTKKTIVVAWAPPSQHDSARRAIALHLSHGAAPLDERVAELAGAGIEAAAFAADLTNLDGIPEVVRSIEAQFGAIDVAVYAPVGVTAMLLLTQQRRDDPFQSLCGPGGFARVPAVVDQQALAVDREFTGRRQMRP